MGVDEHVCDTPAGATSTSPSSPHLTGVHEETGPARLLDMVQGRSKAVFKTWFAEQPQVWRASIKTVVMDGFTGFKTAAEEISEAVPVMDPFHVVRLAGGRPGRVPPTHPTRNPRPTRPGRGPALPGPTYPSHRAGLLTDKQKNRLDALFADDRHVQVEATRAICGPPGTGPCFVGFLCCFGCGGG
ncbi:transposase, partial [Propionibacterium acidifaciens]|uniref:transposase n=1 Tax=Propionibacterium acidifaciens TaxID=556499 RepID=UPI0036F23F37